MILAIIQARMSSVRLPGKVMKEILGKPLIGHLIERLSFAQRIDKIIIATSTNSENDVLAKYVESLGYSVFRGSEDDVLDRFCQAARQHQATHIVRITGDTMLIDPEICDRLIETYLNSKANYACLSPRFAEGVDCEVFSLAALERVNEKAKLKSEREHVTLYINNHPKLFQRVILDSETDDGKTRFTVDEKEDWEVVREIVAGLYQKDQPPFGLAAIKQFLLNNPQLINKNKHITRNEGYLKSLREDGLFNSDVKT